MKIDPSLIRNCPIHGAHTGKNCPLCGPSQRGLEQVTPPPASFRIVITGQIMGGKNNIIVTRTGHRFPKPAWAKWRDDAVRQVKQFIPRGFTPIDSPINVRIDYFAEDKRRRDMPAILDAIFHVFEKAGVVTDDWHLWVSESSRGFDKDCPRAVVTFLKTRNCPAIQARGE